MKENAALLHTLNIEETSKRNEAHVKWVNFYVLLFHCFSLPVFNTITVTCSKNTKEKQVRLPFIENYTSAMLRLLKNRRIVY